MTEGGYVKLYETTFIMDPQLLDDGWDKAVARYSEIITRNGQIKRTERWGLRRMAYPIKKRTQGYYVHLVHESAPSVPRELERQFLLDENCLRYLTVTADNPMYLEEMDRRRVAREEAEASAASMTPAAESGAVPEAEV
jgi:small subunit ribosomal protein S6